MNTAIASGFLLVTMVVALPSAAQQPCIFAAEPIGDDCTRRFADALIDVLCSPNVPVDVEGGWLDLTRNSQFWTTHGDAIRQRIAGCPFESGNLDAEAEGLFKLQALAPKPKQPKQKRTYLLVVAGGNDGSKAESKPTITTAPPAPRSMADAIDSAADRIAGSVASERDDVVAAIKGVADRIADARQWLIASAVATVLGSLALVGLAVGLFLLTGILRGLREARGNMDEKVWDSLIAIEHALAKIVESFKADIVAAAREPLQEMTEKVQKLEARVDKAQATLAQLQRSTAEGASALPSAAPPKDDVRIASPGYQLSTGAGTANWGAGSRAVDQPPNNVIDPTSQLQELVANFNNMLHLDKAPDCFKQKYHPRPYGISDDGHLAEAERAETAKLWLIRLDGVRALTPSWYAVYEKSVAVMGDLDFARQYFRLVFDIESEDLDKDFKLAKPALLSDQLGVLEKGQFWLKRGS